ncbi:hypothetical protein ACFTWF_34305 [Rhodococcus sp. NPDC056960]|uniref:hypothetical protein n=1 Tax=Rhodococcus sp. NPDC056960 TaxID=3345982 RepID=UPI00362A5026
MTGAHPVSPAMTAGDDARASRLVARFQRCLLGLSLLSCVFVAVELASLRHWKTGAQYVPWYVLAVIAVSGLVMALAPTRLGVLQARVVSLVSVPAALFGVYEHVAANLETGVLNHRYDWTALPGWEHLWLASTGAVGGTPALTPLVLALAGTLLGLATVGMATMVGDRVAPR